MEVPAQQDMATEDDGEKGPFYNDVLASKYYDAGYSDGLCDCGNHCHSCFFALLLFPCFYVWRVTSIVNRVGKLQYPGMPDVTFGPAAICASIVSLLLCTSMALQKILKEHIEPSKTLVELEEFITFMALFLLSSTVFYMAMTMQFRYRMQPPFVDPD